VARIPAQIGGHFVDDDASRGLGLGTLRANRRDLHVRGGPAALAGDARGTVARSKLESEALAVPLSVRGR
jgi:hypothetical protein